MLPLRMLGTLMLMFLLCDANSMCPTELNPLTLDPPKVVEKYGASVLVNCTSTEDDHNGIYWTVNKEVQKDMEDEKNFITWPISLSDWDVKAECKIKLTNTHECSKDLEITVYKTPDIVSVSVLNHGPMVEGTEYLLKCDIINVAPVQKLKVTWYRGNETVHTQQMFDDTNVAPVNVSTTLRVTAERDYNAALFSCKAELHLGPEGPELIPTATSSPYIAVVHYAPELKDKMDFNVSVNEGSDVTLNCEAEGNPPPVFHWTCDGVNILENANNLNITRVHASATYHCTATNYLGNTTKQIHVHVIKTTKTTALGAATIPEPSAPTVCPLILSPAEIVVRFGDPASVNCSTSATGVVGMGWEAAFGGTGFQKPPAVTWRVEKLEEWKMEPKCYMTLKNNHQCHVMPAITLYKTPDTVSVSVLNHGPMVEGTEYLLKCDIINVAPVQKLKVTWYRGNETVHTQQMFDDTNVAPVNVSTTLRVTAERDYNAALFSCKAELHLGPEGPELIPTATSSPYIAVVHYAPVITEKNYNRKVSPGENVTFDCLAEGNPPPKMRWNYTPAVNVRETTGWHQTSISITRATSTNAGVYICVASNKVRNVTRPFTLQMKDKAFEFPPALIVGLIILLVFVCIIILVISVHRCWKKHGQYSFVADKSFSDIPMTTQSDGVQA